jgi:hypothetical protein
MADETADLHVPAGAPRLANYADAFETELGRISFCQMHRTEIRRDHDGVVRDRRRDGGRQEWYRAHDLEGDREDRVYLGDMRVHEHGPVGSCRLQRIGDHP